MQITTIKYEETFPTAIQYKNIRLTAEAKVDADYDNITDSYQKLKTAVNDAFKAMNPESYYNTGVISRDTYLHTEAEQKQEDR